jgi:hypothetical protein
MRFMGDLSFQLCVVVFVLELAFGLLEIHMLNIFELLIFQKKIFYFPEITDDNLRFRVHPSVITVEQLAVMHLNALQKDGNVERRYCQSGVVGRWLFGFFGCRLDQCFGAGLVSAGG